MALARPLAPLACTGCQRWVLRSFIAAIGGHTRPVPVHRPLQRRPFSRTPARLNETREEGQKVEHALNEINDEVSHPINPTAPALTYSAPPEPQTHLPWYLQVQSQSQPQPSPSSPLTSAQTLPPLPTNPPPLPTPLLTHLSTTLGIDTITLLDLRTLDPPPALGANLLMLLGTARSEKHLHVSADRLCRWLRTEYKLSPYADGLLGRGELKILMRRRAKRGRVLGAVGAKATGGGELEEGDDGVRTGWVCVNVGRVEGGEMVSKENSEEGFVGFGTRRGGTSIVVQLFTEEKREEIGLEALWGDVLTKAERDKQALRELEGDGGEVASAEDAASEMDAVDTASPRRLQSDPSLHLESRPHVSTQISTQQLRGYHTSLRQMNATTKADLALREETIDLSPTHTTSPSDPSIDKLTHLLTTLQSLPRPEALEALGPNLLNATQIQDLSLPSNANSVSNRTPASLTPSPRPETTAATPFLTTFYTTIPSFPTATHWHMHIALLAHARHLGHPDAHSPVLLAQLQNMQIAGLIPEERTFLLVLKAILRPLGEGEGVGYGDGYGYDGVERVASRAKMEGVLGLLEEMEGCGYDVLAPEVLGVLGVACGGAAPGSTSTATAASMSGSAPVSAAVGADTDAASPGLGPHAVTLSNLLPMLHGARLRRLLYRENEDNNDREAFWRLWRSYPQRFLPRTAEMYVVLFEALGRGKLGVGREAGEILRDGLEEMEYEEPEVRVEKDERLSVAVRQAIEFVSEGEAARAEVGREWRGWYQRCGGVARVEG